MGEVLSETPDTRVVLGSVLQNAADGAAAALELVSSALSADDDLVESEESVRLRNKPQEPAPAASLPALAEVRVRVGLGLELANPKPKRTLTLTLT